ncbi:hypothetical protein ABT255_57550 [Streptomyces mirabilis]|uniref:hypothetical protein n=1 Tax=Streptomyces mirabilis TaxID=68239 RepID=UPI0033317365
MDETIEVERAAVAAIPVGHPDRAVHLTRLGNALQARFKHNGNPEALFEAIEVGRAAVATTPDDHPDRAARDGVPPSGVAAIIAKVQVVDQMQIIDRRD